MCEKYIPEYAKGEILVCFKEDFLGNFPKQFGKGIGYELKEEIDYLDSVASFYVNEGEEEKAIEEFQGQKNFILWAEKRDLRFEKRIEFTKNLEDKVKALDGTLTKDDFLNQIQEIRTYLKNVDESI
ncbi:hypothetical protein HOD29_03080 [archaeon]|jgi:hypothetical protein|nr:hypothetical protein [archaeon]